MLPERIRTILAEVAEGKMTRDRAFDLLQHLPFEPLGFANVDHHRAMRCGFPEVVLCQGKTIDQTTAIFGRLAAAGGNVLATRADPDQAKALLAAHPKAQFHSTARCVSLRQISANPSVGTIAVVTAGTADLPVADEARVTCEIMDQRTVELYDVGVAGIHRLLARSEELRSARVIIVIAGMEGALPSVVGGLVEAPVIAVPTSVGYGASFGGVAPLLTMLNTCATGVAVVNIDNGFGAGYLAAMINRLGEQRAQ